MFALFVFLVFVFIFLCYCVLIFIVGTAVMTSLAVAYSCALVSVANEYMPCCLGLNSNNTFTIAPSNGPFLVVLFLFRYEYL